MDHWEVKMVSKVGMSRWSASDARKMADCSYCVRLTLVLADCSVMLLLLLSDSSFKRVCRDDNGAWPGYWLYDCQGCEFMECDIDGLSYGQGGIMVNALDHAILMPPGHGCLWGGEDTWATGTSVMPCFHQGSDTDHYDHTVCTVTQLFCPSCPYRTLTLDSLDYTTWLWRLKWYRFIRLCKMCRVR